MATNTATRLSLRHETIKPKIGARILNTKEELLSGELTEAINPSRARSAGTKVGDWTEYAILGKSVLVVRTESGIKAFHDHCRHRGVPIAGGY